VRLREIPEVGLLARCRQEGLAWHIGPFSVRLKTRLREVANGVALLYAEFPLAEQDTIVDAEIHVEREAVRPGKVRIRVDGIDQYKGLRRSLTIPLLEWTMNVCVFQRPHEYFMLHAAVVERNGRAVLLPGRAGSGKSTLCAGLIHRGWRLLSDEVALIRPGHGDLLPVPRPVSLKDKSIGVIRRFAPDAILGPEWPGTAKGTVAHMLPPAVSVARAHDVATPRWIVFPSFSVNAPTSLESIKKGTALMRAADNSFNYSVHGERGFMMLSDLIDRCECYELTFGNLDDAIETIDEFSTVAGKSPTAERP